MTNCSIVWQVFEGDISNQLLLFFIAYCYSVCFLGTLCNVAVLACVVGCPRTRPSIKVLLCGLFSSTLLMCLLVMPFMAHAGTAKLHCDKQIPRTLLRVMVGLYIALTEMELIYITIIALLRAVAVWSSKRRHVTMAAALTLFMATVVYCIVSTLLVMVPLWVDVVNYDTFILMSLIYNSINILAPVVVTVACYLSMIFAVRHNKRRLAASQHVVTAAGQQVMDQATRAMLALFVSNLFFCLPHSIYHTLPQDFHVFSYIIVHCLFYTHLLVDPLAYLCFNVHHRRRVLHTLTSFTRWATCRHLAPSAPYAASTLPLHVTPPTSSDDTREEEG